MRQSLCLVLVALILAVSARPQALITIAEVDRRCSSDADCTIVGVDCCAESNCAYGAVNTTMVGVYVERLAAASATSCGNVCNARACLPPVRTCVFAQISSGTSRVGLCTLGQPVDPTVPVPVNAPAPTVTRSPPKMEGCQVMTGGANCEAICVSSMLAMPAIACLPTVTQDCINTCKTTFAVCKMANSSNTISGQSCQFVASDVTGYQGCVDKCRAVPPPPPVDRLQCTTIKGEKCESQCVIANGIVAPVSNTTCTASEEVACFNKCQAFAECSATTLGCRYVPTNETAYLSCRKECSTPNTRRCFKSGCSGEICSSVSVISTCDFSCEKGCYSAASCGANADGSCGFTMTNELKVCLDRCDKTEIPPPVGTCKIAGCQRELCVPSTITVPQCDAAIAETSCETSCLQFATCEAVGVTRSVPSSPICGWAPDATNPGAYGECLLKCREPANPCFVSGCGSVCSTVASLQPCQASLIAPDCPTACKQKFTSCGMTNSGCNFLPVDGLQRCLDACPKPTEPAPVDRVCPPTLPKVECLVNPCETASCPAFPNAKCTPNYCGSCRAVFTNPDGVPVNCESSCTGLSCSECQAKSGCSFCSGEYQTATGSNAFGVCVATNGFGTEKCLASNGRLLAADSTCPVVSGPKDVTTSVGDTDAVQAEVAQSTKPVLQQFSLIITLVVNESTSNTEGFHLINMFLDVIGTGKPSTTQMTEICEILKDAVAKMDPRIKKRAALTCNLEEKTTVKRDVGYTAALSFPANTNNNVNTGSASAILLSFAAVAVAILALF